MRLTRLKESDEYQRQREELRVAELALTDHVERIAALRRALPADTVVDDYEFVDVATGDAVARHVSQTADFVVLAAAEPAAIQAHAASRGWDNLRLVSAGDSSFKYDLGSEEADGAQIEWISVFSRGPDATIRHVYSKGAEMADDRRERGIDLLSPVWHLLDLTPHGRDDWYPSLDYQGGLMGHELVVLPDAAAEGVRSP